MGSSWTAKRTWTADSGEPRKGERWILGWATRKVRLCHCLTCTYVREKIVAPSGQELDPVFIPCLARDLLQDVPGLAELIAEGMAEKN